MSDAIRLAFGNQSGSLFTLVLFGGTSAIPGWAVARTLRRPVQAILAGLPAFLFPVVLISGR